MSTSTQWARYLQQLAAAWRKGITTTHNNFPQTTLPKQKPDKPGPAKGSGTKQNPA